jgi:hypothetical protein
MKTFSFHDTDEQVNANLPMRPYESSQQLHWSSGTVTSSANATPSSAPSIFAESGNYGHNEPDSAVLGLVGLGVKIKREDGAIEYERQGRDCSNSIELGRLLPSSNFDSPPVSKSEPEDYSNAKTKGSLQVICYGLETRYIFHTCLYSYR